MERYVCTHGHFYQPPRENPSLEAVEIQDSAYPYHDWDERITAECYGPNSASRILDGEGRIDPTRASALRLPSGRTVGLFFFDGPISRAAAFEEPLEGGGVREFRARETYDVLAREMADAFARADLPELLRAVDRNFGSNTYSLRLLFRDQQRKILGTILNSTLGDAESVCRQIYEHQAPQNCCFEMTRTAPDGLRRQILKSNTDVRAWLDHFASLARDSGFGWRR